MSVRKSKFRKKFSAINTPCRLRPGEKSRDSWESEKSRLSGGGIFLEGGSPMNAFYILNECFVINLHNFLHKNYYSLPSKWCMF